MTIVPVVLDASPHYLGGSQSSGSLLLLPAPDAGLLREIARSVAEVTSHQPFVLPSFVPDATYEPRLREACPGLAGVLTPEQFRDTFDRFEPSDALLFVAPSWYPTGGVDLHPLCDESTGNSGMVRHLLAFEATSHRTKELVQAGGDGRVRRIQRYFDPVTWPFPSGVLASLVPIACVQMTGALSLGSLEELRLTLAACGVPSHDVPFRGECFDLSDEVGALALAERRLHAMLAHREIGLSREAAGATLRAPRATVSPTARLVGPVLVAADVVVEDNALVIGPAVIANGARIGRDTVVAQCVVMPGVTIADGATVRHRVVVARAHGERDEVWTAGSGQRRHAPPAALSTLTADPSRGTARLTYVAVKSVVEPVLALGLIVVLSPLLLLLAVLVPIGSPGPIFYGDEREGKDARPFRCWKFRSMRTNADAMQRTLNGEQQMDGPQFKMANDPRVTPTGRWIRRLNVDELPQLWNVVLGEMSFVGPRPSPFRENQICVPWRHGRLSVRPGITGLWQVCRHDRALGDFHQWIHYDLLYVRNMSFMLDVRIFVATVVTLGGRRPVPLAWILGRRALAKGRAAAPAAAPGTTPPRSLPSVTRRVLVVAGAAALGLPVRTLHAQTPDRTNAAESARTVRNVWRLSLSGDQGWESNARFVEADGAGDYVSRVGGGVFVGRQSGRARLVVAAAGGTTRYRTTSELNTINYEGTVDGALRLTPRLAGSLSGFYRTSLSSGIATAGTSGTNGANGAGSSPASPTPDAGGTALPLLPLTLTHSVGGATGGAWRVTARTDVTLAADYTRVTFDTPLLVPGNAVTARAVAEHRYGVAGAMLLTADAQQGSAAGRALDTQTLGAGWQQAFGRFAARMRAGATRVAADAPADVSIVVPLAPYAVRPGTLYGASAGGSRVVPTGNAELSLRLSRGGPGAHRSSGAPGSASASGAAGGAIASARYERTVGQAFGLGQLLVTDQGSVGFDLVSRGGTVLRLGASRAWSRDASAPADRLTSSEAVAELRHELPAGVSLGGGVSYRDRSVPSGSISGIGARLLVGYTVGSR